MKNFLRRCALPLAFALILNSFGVAGQNAAGASAPKAPLTIPALPSTIAAAAPIQIAAPTTPAPTAAQPAAPILAAVSQALPAAEAARSEKPGDAAQAQRLDRLYVGSAQQDAPEAVDASDLVHSAPPSLPPSAPGVSRNSNDGPDIYRPAPHKRSPLPKILMGSSAAVAIAVVAAHGLFPAALGYGIALGLATGYAISIEKLHQNDYDSVPLALVVALGGLISLMAGVNPNWATVGAATLAGGLLGYGWHEGYYQRVTHDWFPTSLPYRQGSAVEEGQKRVIAAFLNGNPSNEEVLDFLRELERPQGEWLLAEMSARAKTPGDFIKIVKLQQTIQDIESLEKHERRGAKGADAYLESYIDVHTLDTHLISILYTKIFWDRFMASNPSFEQIMTMRREMADTLYYTKPPANDVDRAYEKDFRGQGKAVMVEASLRAARSPADFLRALGEDSPDGVLDRTVGHFGALAPKLAQWASLLPKARGETAARIRRQALVLVRTPADYLSIAPFVDSIEGFPVFLSAHPGEKDIRTQIKLQVGDDYKAQAEFALKALALTTRPTDYVNFVKVVHGLVGDQKVYSVYVKPKIEQTLAHFRSLNPTAEESASLAKAL